MLHVMFTFLLGVSVCLAPRAHAQEELIDPQTLIFSVVKIVNESADIFSADPDSSHGTGFFVGVDSQTKKGIIFTNKHVIEKDENAAQRLMLEFNTLQRRGETIEAKLVYSSLLHDFAVLEFDPKKLKRATHLKPLPLPSKTSPFYDFMANERSLRGLDVMAIGNPFEGSNVTTYGQITGLHFDPEEGPFIQTQTPINPGNSGGPLICLETGEVIGINTMTMTGADGTHWSIPIGVLMQEYNEWRLQKKKNIYPTIADARWVNFNMSLMGEGLLRQMRLHEPVEKAIPGYFETYNSVLMVTDSRSEELQYGDLLLRMNDQVIGGFPYDFVRRLQRTQGQVKMQVLRAGKLIDIHVTVPNVAYSERRREVDYVYLSGVFIQQMPSAVKDKIRTGLESLVMVKELVDSPEVNFSGHNFPLPGSVIAGVSFGGAEIPVRNLFDLKKALRENQKNDFVILHAYRANFGKNGQGHHVPLLSQSTGAPFVDGTKDVFVLSTKDVVTPSMFSLHKFKKQFSFAADGAETRDWRAFVDRQPKKIHKKVGKKADCEDALVRPSKK